MEDQKKLQQKKEDQGVASAPPTPAASSAPTTGPITSDVAHQAGIAVPHRNEGDELNISSAVAQYADAIYLQLGTDVEPRADGAIHRFDDPEKRPGNKNCWAYMDESGTYGVYGNWRTEERYEWYLDDFQAISDEDLAAIMVKVDFARQKRAHVRHAEQDRTAARAVKVIKKAVPAAVDHPYLQRKWIPPANALQNGGDLVIPLCDTDGRIRNLQRINPGGKKRFLKGGQITGNFALIGANELPATGCIIVCEGWATGVTLHQTQGWPVAAAMNAGNLGPVCSVLRDKLADSVTIIVAADDDRHSEGNPGLTKAYAAADATSAEVIRPEFPCPDCDCTDFNDVAVCLAKNSPDSTSPHAGPRLGHPATTERTPIPLTTELPPVKLLVAEMLPDNIAGFVMDSATRLQIPPDYLAVAVITVAAGVIGGKRRVLPKQQDDWLVTPTCWAGLIGPPSSLKSASITAATKPLQELEDERAKAYEHALEFYQCDKELGELHFKDAKKDASADYDKDREKAVKALLDASFTDPPPIRQRYVVNDATVEKLGEIMSENPNGLILVRDELTGLFSKLSQEEHQGDRAFYLECFEGNSSFTWDRITRGTIEVPNCVLSILGGVQPSRIAPIIRKAIDGDIDDGLIQRFQLAVWPDIPKNWKWIDREPDAAAFTTYRDTLRQLHELPGYDPEDAACHLRFSLPAQALYIAWTEQIQARARSDSFHTVMQSHLAKMPKTIAGLALLFELLDGGRDKVGEEATAKAIMWSEYLISHAERLYSLSTGASVANAKLILARRDKLPEVFTAREVQRKSWAGLTTARVVSEALEYLVDHRYLTELPVRPGSLGGRPTTRYRWSPSSAPK